MCLRRHLWSVLPLVGWVTTASSAMALGTALRTQLVSQEVIPGPGIKASGFPNVGDIIAQGRGAHIQLDIASGLTSF